MVIEVNAIQIPQGTYCIPSTTNHHFSRFWIPALLFETLLSGMAIHAASKTFESKGDFLCRGQTLMQVLIRDSIAYFFMSVSVLKALFLYDHSPC